MTVKQLFLKALYPVFIGAGKIFGIKAGIRKNNDRVLPPASFYDLTATSITGGEIRFTDFKNKYVLLVNTASDCGYTNQYEQLEKLYQLYKNQLIIIAFPSNDFKEQEKLSDNEIASFCKVNFGVTFLIAAKTVVIKERQQNEVFNWLSDKHKNGWNDKAPEWNFSKYLVNKEGVLTMYLGPAVEPLDIEITRTLSFK